MSSHFPLSRSSIDLPPEGQQTSPWIRASWVGFGALVSTLLYTSWLWFLQEHTAPKDSSYFAIRRDPIEVGAQLQSIPKLSMIESTFYYLCDLIMLPLSPRRHAGIVFFSVIRSDICIFPTIIKKYGCLKRPGTRATQRINRAVPLRTEIWEYRIRIRLGQISRPSFNMRRICVTS